MSAGKLQPGDAVGILEGVRTAFNGQQRRLGFEDAMKAAGMNVVDSQSGQWEMNLANRVSSAMLSESAAARPGDIFLMALLFLPLFVWRLRRRR